MPRQNNLIFSRSTCSVRLNEIYSTDWISSTLAASVPRIGWMSKTSKTSERKETQVWMRKTRPRKKRQMRTLKLCLCIRRWRQNENWCSCGDRTSIEFKRRGNEVEHVTRVAWKETNSYRIRFCLLYVVLLFCCCWPFLFSMCRLFALCKKNNRIEPLFWPHQLNGLMQSDFGHTSKPNSFSLILSPLYLIFWSEKKRKNIITLIKTPLDNFCLGVN